MKRLLSLVLPVLAVAVISSCGGGNKSKKEDPKDKVYEIEHVALGSLMKYYSVENVKLTFGEWEWWEGMAYMPIVEFDMVKNDIPFEVDSSLWSYCYNCISFTQYADKGRWFIDAVLQDGEHDALFRFSYDFEKLLKYYTNPGDVCHFVLNPETYGIPYKRNADVEAIFAGEGEFIFIVEAVMKETDPM